MIESIDLTYLLLDMGMVPTRTTKDIIDRTGQSQLFAFDQLCDSSPTISSHGKSSQGGSPQIAPAKDGKSSGSRSVPPRLDKLKRKKSTVFGTQFRVGLSS